MKLRRIFAAIAACAIAATMAVSASAYTILCGGDENSGVGFNLTASSEGKVGDNWDTSNNNKKIIDNFDIPEDKAASVASVDVNLTCLDINPKYDADGNPTGDGWANIQWFVSDGGAGWAAGRCSAVAKEADGEKVLLLKKDTTIDIKAPMILKENGGYAVGFESYGGGAFEVNYVSFLDKDGNEVAKWAKEGTEGVMYEGYPTESTTDPGSSETGSSETGSSNPGSSSTGAAGGTTNPTTGATAGLALAGLAIAGAAVVAAKKSK